MLETILNYIGVGFAMALWGGFCLMVGVFIDKSRLVDFINKWLK